MEETEKSKLSVWLGGAVSSAIKGIPQGILLGLGGALMLWGLAVALPTLGLFATFEGFLFTGTAAAIGINPIPFTALNTVLTIVGNALLGGDMAVNKRQQEIDHAKNEARISAIEAREQAVEQVSAHPRSVRVDSIIRSGPCPTKPALDQPSTVTVDSILRDGAKTQDSFAVAEDMRDAAPTPQRTLH